MKELTGLINKQIAQLLEISAILPQPMHTRDLRLEQEQTIC
jgi:hypothetical protein